MAPPSLRIPIRCTGPAAYSTEFDSLSLDVAPWTLSFRSRGGLGGAQRGRTGEVEGTAEARRPGRDAELLGRWRGTPEDFVLRLCPQTLFLDFVHAGHERTKGGGQRGEDKGGRTAVAEEPRSRGRRGETRSCWGGGGRFASIRVHSRFLFPSLVTL